MSSDILLLESINQKYFLGRGSYGCVYKLIENGRTPSALKRFDSEHETAFSSFKKECKALEELRHPNIVQYFGFHDEIIDGQRILAIRMELCENGALSQCIFEKTFRYTIFTVVTWAEELFSGLDYLHKKGRIHRDIKTDNILLDQDFHLKLGDFGLVDVHQKAHGEAGTERFMAPELRFGDENGKICVSPANDIWAAGLVLWEVTERRNILSLKKNHDKMDLLEAIESDLEKLMGPEELKKVIWSSLRWAHEERGKAPDLLRSCRQMRKVYASLRTCYEFRPNKNANQLFRPRGFDLKVGEIDSTIDEVPVDEVEDDFKDLLPPDISSLGTIDHLKAEKPADESWSVVHRKTLVDYPELQNLINNNTYKNIKNDLKMIFEKIPAEQLEQYAEIAMRTLRKEKDKPAYLRLQKEIALEMWNYLADHQTMKSEGDLEEDVKNAMSRAVESCSYQLQIIYFDTIKFFSFFKELDYGIWSPINYVFHVKNLLNMYKNVFFRRFYLYSYFSRKLKEEWLYVGEIGEGQHVFLKKDLNDAKTLKGAFSENQERFLVNEGDETGQRYEFIVFAPIDPDDLISALDRFERRVQIFMQLKLRELNEETDPDFQVITCSGETNLPVENYVFQLRNPPRIPCNSQCKKKNFPTSRKTREEISLKVCQHTSKEQFDFLYAYTTLADILIPDLAHLSYLNINQVQSRHKCDEFLFCKHMDPSKANWLLLDYPKSAKESEKIVAIDENYLIHVIDVKQEEILRDEFNRRNVYELIKRVAKVRQIKATTWHLTRGINLVDVLRSKKWAAILHEEIEGAVGDIEQEFGTESKNEAVKELMEMFPTIEENVIRLVYEEHNGDRQAIGVTLVEML